LLSLRQQKRNNLPFINLHSHKSPDDGSLAIVNCSGDFDALAEKGLFSAGLHPWYLNAETVDFQFESLKANVFKASIIAIGECGLDRVCDTPWELQAQTFIRQINLANEINKPMIIHCVRAFDEVLSLLKQNNNKQAVIFHGFNKNLVLARRIIEAGHYLSFGNVLRNKNIQDIFVQLPLNKLFLETDASEVSIKEQYQLAADLLNISSAELIKQIEKNAGLIFGPALI
jgi:TatD DNase family protein